VKYHPRLAHLERIKMDSDTTAKEPRDEEFTGVLVGVPTFGKISASWVISQLTMATPIFTSMGYMFIEKKPVDVARNEIAYNAVHTMGSDFVFFRDDDVVIEREHFLKLYNRVDPKQKAMPYSCGDSIIGATVYSKVQPPTPMIFKKSVTGGFEDWRDGDLVECDVVGMGCTLIPVGVFKKMEPNVNFHQCVNRNCLVRWYAEYKEPGNCPHCGSILVPGWFKTIRDKTDEGEAAFMTEDSYFCMAARKQGFNVYADCGVHCWHEDYATETQYGFHPQVGPCWKKGDTIMWWPHKDTDIAKSKCYTPKSKDVKFNIGCGGTMLKYFSDKGYINIDMFTEGCDFRCNIKDLSPAVEQYGQADEIYAGHVLEHIEHNLTLNTVRNWLKALKPGGKLFIEVPDGRWAMENFLKSEDEGRKTAHYFDESIVYGLQNHPGEFHFAAITEKKMKTIIRACRNQIAEYEMKLAHPEGHNQQVIQVWITKKDGPAKKATPKRKKKAAK
jgi:predicted SAM-dependent methyltransferase